jgi:Zn finger protein HypA/HybF involved in hydrogenase expression
MAKKELELRCRLCHQIRFKITSFQEVAECPQCGSKWRLRWFDDDTPLIIGPVSWVEWERKAREELQ